MELVDLVPNSLTFRVINTIDVEEEADVPAGYSGRVRRYLEGTLVYVAWNPGRSSPAYRRLRADGKLKYEMFYSRGLLDDPLGGGAAIRGYYADGSLHYQEHYRSGKRHDAIDGSPAIRKWRQDGTVRHELRYVDGRRSVRPRRDDSVGMLR